MNGLRCSACAGTMQAFFVSDVEIDACNACAGLWFDWGELGKVAKVPMRLERLAGATERKCPRCAIAMQPALLPQAVPVETCGQCKGFFLDADELDELAQRPIPVGKRNQPEAPQGGGVLPGPQFSCISCEQRFPTTAGHFYRGGLACASCAPQVQTTEGERRAANGHVRDIFGLQDGRGSMGLFDILFGFGRRFY